MEEVYEPGSNGHPRGRSGPVVAFTPDSTRIVVSAAAPLPRATLVSAPVDHAARRRRFEQPRDVGSRRRPAPDVRADLALGRAVAIVGRRRSIVSAAPPKSRCCRIRATACGSKRSSRMTSRRGTATTTTNGRPRDAGARTAWCRASARRSPPIADGPGPISAPVIQAFAEFHGVRVDQPLRDRRRRRLERDARSVENSISISSTASTSATRASQGVAIARLLWADRDRPVDASSCGAAASGNPKRAAATLAARPCRALSGAVSSGSTPPRRRSLRRRSRGTTATTRSMRSGDRRCTGTAPLEQYVMLLNRAKDENYTQEGIYVSVRAASRRSVAVERAAEDPERRPLVPAGGRFVRRYRDGQARGRLAAIFHERKIGVGD